MFWRKMIQKDSSFCIRVTGYYGLFCIPCLSERGSAENEEKKR